MAREPVNTVGGWALAIGLAGVLAGAMANASEVYKWVDEQGNVHFGDRPADGSGLSIRPAQPSTAPSAQRDSSNIGEIMEEDRLNRKEHKAREEQDRAERLRRCHVARDHLRGLTTAGAVYNLDQSGQRVILNREQRKQAEARARREIAEWCDD